MTIPSRTTNTARLYPSTACMTIPNRTTNTARLYPSTACAQLVYLHSGIKWMSRFSILKAPVVFRHGKGSWTSRSAWRDWLNERTVESRARASCVYIAVGLHGIYMCVCVCVWSGWYIKECDTYRAPIVLTAIRPLGGGWLDRRAGWSDGAGSEKCAGREAGPSRSELVAGCVWLPGEQSGVVRWSTLSARRGS